MKKFRFLSVSLLILIAAVASAAETSSPSDSSLPTGQPVPSAKQKAASNSATLAGHSRMGSMAVAKNPQNGEPISGKVLESMNNGGYSYIYLQQKKGGKVWIAVNEIPVKTGSVMSFKPGMVMTNFESKGLKRTFDKIIFTDGVAATTVGTADKLKKSSPGSKGSTTGKVKKISVKKAAGANAVTVAGAFINRTNLDKKKVVVRGKVVKVSAGIMKRNWIHIQDGTGSQAKGTYDLVCTSTDKADVGDVVTVSGILAKDRDFGSGYRYTAIIENAKLKK